MDIEYQKLHAAVVDASSELARDMQSYDLETGEHVEFHEAIEKYANAAAAAGYGDYRGIFNATAILCGAIRAAELPWGSALG